MTEYRVELQSATTTFITVEASTPERAAEKAEDVAYDDVIEADRSAWTAVSVQRA